MPDYKKMYFDLFRATEAAIGTLIEAQQRCEEMLLEEPEPPLPRRSAAAAMRAAAERPAALPLRRCLLQFDGWRVDAAS